MNSIVIVLVFLYFLMNVALILIWIRGTKVTYKTDVEPQTTISVIIPVRNEEEHILNLLEDLDKQTYPKTLFEVIIADDDSNDDTPHIVEHYQKISNFNLIINRLPEKIANTSPKKRAIESSINLATGTLIVCTDGDCRVPATWLESIVDFQQKTGAYLISSPVTFYIKSDNFFEKAQIIEFASLIGAGACAMMVNYPTMCNGANIAYLKSVFYEVEGFKGNEYLASGDDEFLMHKIAKKFPGKVCFLKNQEVIVQTEAHQSLRSFYFQRKRWASKWKHYSNWQPTALAVFVFLANLALPSSFLLYISEIIQLKDFLLVGLLKFSAEFIYLFMIARFLGKSSIWVYIPLVQIIYPFYVVFFGLMAQGKNEYIWKGRTLK